MFCLSAPEPLNITSCDMRILGLRVREVGVAQAGFPSGIARWLDGNTLPGLSGTTLLREQYRMKYEVEAIHVEAH